MINITRDYESVMLEDNIESFEDDYNHSIECLPIKRDNLIYLLVMQSQSASGGRLI